MKLFRTIFLMCIAILVGAQINYTLPGIPIWGGEFGWDVDDKAIAKQRKKLKACLLQQKKRKTLCYKLNTMLFRKKKVKNDCCKELLRDYKEGKLNL